MKTRTFLMVSMVFLLVAVPMVTYALTLRATTNVPASQPTSQAMKYMGDLITNRTNGRIKFEYHWGGALTKAGEELEAVQRGIAHIGFYAVGYYPSKMILNGVSYVVPFNPPDARLVLKIYEKLAKELPELPGEIDQYNQKLMFYIAFGSYEMLSTKPVKTLADMKGLKVAVIGATMPKWFEAVGAVPISMPAPDRYQALQTGLIGAQVLPVGPSDPFKWTDVAKHCTLVNIGAVILAPVVINTDTWKKLSSEDKKLFLEAAKEAAQWNADKTMEEEASIIAKWKRLGVTFYTLSDSDKKAWADSLKYVPYDWADLWDKKGLPATKILDAYLKAAEALGYKYPVKWMKR
jgi:TRAP-type C4-dicarboxylate transport system substrate-binding protein